MVIFILERTENITMKERRVYDNLIKHQFPISITNRYQFRCETMSYTTHSPVRTWLVLWLVLHPKITTQQSNMYVTHKLYSFTNDLNPKYINPCYSKCSTSSLKLFKVSCSRPFFFVQCFYVLTNLVPTAQNVIYCITQSVLCARAYMQWLNIVAYWTHNVTL